MNEMINYFDYKGEKVAVHHDDDGYSVSVDRDDVFVHVHDEPLQQKPREAQIKHLVRQFLEKEIETIHQRKDGLAIMDAVADVLAERHNIPLAEIKAMIVAVGTETLYDDYIAPAIDDLEDELGLAD
jgi:hypothetical protein